MISFYFLFFGNTLFLLLIYRHYFAFISFHCLVEILTAVLYCSSWTFDYRKRYDFAVFGYFGDILGEVFFPPNQKGHSAMIESFAVFGGAFLMRPGE